ncbi:hypothetical protein [Massilia frigida]|nr:hypothetical protein [Massilia frigida]
MTWKAAFPMYELSAGIRAGYEALFEALRGALRAAASPPSTTSIPTAA